MLNVVRLTKDSYSTKEFKKENGLKLYHCKNNCGNNNMKLIYNVQMICSFERSTENLVKLVLMTVDDEGVNEG